ncbi:hypothetical protein D3C71_1642640 [compost metagenome]
MLRGGRAERCPHLAIERAARPQATGLVEKRRHLRRHAAEARAGADDDRVVLFEVGHDGDRRRLVELEIGSLGDLQRHGLGHTLDVDLRTGTAGAFGDGLGHRFDVAIGRVVQDKNFAHGYLLERNRRTPADEERRLNFDDMALA